MRGKGEGAVYRVPADPKKPLQYWTAVIELPSHGIDPETGKALRRRKVIRRKNKKELLAELAAQRAALQERGDLPTAGMTTAQWFTYWVESIAAKEVRPNTLTGYRAAVTRHIIPTIGRVQLEKLSASHVRRVHEAILAKGLSSTTALLAHRVMSMSLKIAVREGRIGRNPAALTEAPRRAVTTLDVLDLPEAVALLRDTLHDPDGIRWATYLLTATRRGEVLGLEADRVGDALDMSWQLQRIPYVHGCDGKCGRRFGGDCPQRTIRVPADHEYRNVIDGLYWTRPKSRKGWRVIPNVDPLRSILEHHMSVTPSNRHGLVFARPDGRPHDPDLASNEWRRFMIARFGEERSVRLHDLRHTTIDLLYLAGVPEDLIQEIVGHSTRAQSREYRSRGNMERLTGAMKSLSAILAEQGLPERKAS